MKTGPRSYGSKYGLASRVNSTTESQLASNVLRLSPNTIITLPVYVRGPQKK